VLILLEMKKKKKYIIEHKKHGCYEVCLTYTQDSNPHALYLTNFRNKKAAENFIKEHKRGNVVIDPETRIPTPDFK